jgi:hypothetical protein
VLKFLTRCARCVQLRQKQERLAYGQQLQQQMAAQAEARKRERMDRLGIPTAPGPGQLGAEPRAGQLAGYEPQPQGLGMAPSYSPIRDIPAAPAHASHATTAAVHVDGSPPQPTYLTATASQEPQFNNTPGMQSAAAGPPMWGSPNQHPVVTAAPYTFAPQPLPVAAGGGGNGVGITGVPPGAYSPANMQQLGPPQVSRPSPGDMTAFGVKGPAGRAVQRAQQDAYRAALDAQVTGDCVYVGCSHALSCMEDELRDTRCTTDGHLPALHTRQLPRWLPEK